MAKLKLINGLPHDLVQSFFSTLNYWEKGYMCDWIVNTALDFNIKDIKMDILNKCIEPEDLMIKPLLYNLNELDKIIDKSLDFTGLTRNNLTNAYFDIKILDNRWISCESIIKINDDRIIKSPKYMEHSYEIFNINNYI